MGLRGLGAERSLYLGLGASWRKWHLTWALQWGWWAWAQHAAPSGLWPLTSVGDNKDDVLIKGLGAGQSHLSTDLLHHVQGHLRRGKREAALAWRPLPPRPPRPPAQRRGSPRSLGAGRMQERAQLLESERLGFRVGLSLICGLILSWRSPLPQAQAAPLRDKSCRVGEAGGLSTLGGPPWRRGSLPDGDVPSLTVHVLILRWRSRPPGRRKSCLLELRPAWGEEIGEWERPGQGSGPAAVPSVGVPDRDRAGPASARDGVSGPGRLTHPNAPVLTNMARSSMLLGSSRRPPKRSVLCRFCSQALAIPAETGVRAWPRVGRGERGSSGPSPESKGGGRVEEWGRVSALPSAAEETVQRAVIYPRSRARV